MTKITYVIDELGKRYEFPPDTTIKALYLNDMPMLVITTPNSDWHSFNPSRIIVHGIMEQHTGISRTKTPITKK